MKRIIYLAILILGFASCNPNKIAILDSGYIGMTTDEYGKIFAGSYDLPTSSSKINGKLNPEFTNGRLSSLAISVDNISDFDTAYNVYELGNDLSYKYGAPVENKETIWAGGTSKYFKWKKGLLEVEYITTIIKCKARMDYFTPGKQKWFLIKRTARIKNFNNYYFT